MKTLVYQYWKGDMPTYAKVSKKLMQDWANTHGAEYLFEEDPTFFTGKYSMYFQALRPLFDDFFQKYDQVLFLDMDVYPLIGAGSIFDASIKGVAMAREPLQPMLREHSENSITSRRDHRWAKMAALRWKAKVPRDELGRPLVFNSGVVLYGREAMTAGRRVFPAPNRYVFAATLAALPRFYRLDQNYLGVMAHRNGVTFTELDEKWNIQLHNVKLKGSERTLLDPRDENSQFIHLQTSGRRDLSEDNIMEIVKNRLPNSQISVQAPV